MKKQSKPLVYLASIYSHSEVSQRLKNYEEAAKISASLIANGHIVLSPIAYGHNLIEFTHMPTNWEFWMDFCLTILSRCDELWILNTLGWENSRGIKEEIIFAKDMNIPIKIITPLGHSLSGNFYDIRDY